MAARTANLEQFKIASVEKLDEAKELGHGCYGAVYEVRLHGSLCVAKRVHDYILASILVGRGIEEPVSDGERRATINRFREECKLLSGLRHPNVVQFMGVHYGRDEADISLIMEYMHMDLDQCMKTYPNIPLPYKTSILRDVAYGLAYLHSIPIMHRDVNATNVLLTESLRAKIAGFTVAKPFDRVSALIRTQTSCPGALDFMPPECLSGSPKYDSQLDIFSFGHLITCLANQKYTVLSDSDITMYDVKNKQIQVAKRRRALGKMGGSSHPLYSIAVLCLSDTPDQRPTSRDLVKRMEKLCEEQPLPYKTTLPTPAIMIANDLELMANKKELKKPFVHLKHFAVTSVEGLDQEIERGRGCYGAVYEIRLHGLPCIAKRLHNILLGRGKEEQVSEEDRKAMISCFREECELLSGLRHPNVVQFMGVHYGRDEADISLIMEYMHMDLDQCMKTYPNIPLPYKTSILRDVAYGLAYLHSIPIIHRDLNAGNVLLTESLRAKIADLGVAKLFDKKTAMIQTRTLCPGAQDFMPPECFDESPKYTTQLDIFSFGHLVIFLANQQAPVLVDSCVTPTDVQKKQMQVGKRRRALDKISVPQSSLYSIAVQCLSDTPDQRPTSRDLVKRMEELCEKNPLPYENTLQTLTAKDRDISAEKAGRVAELMERQLHQLQEDYQISERLMIDYKKQMNISKREAEDERKKVEEMRKEIDRKQSRIDGVNSQLRLLNNENIQLKRAASNAEIQTNRADRLQNELDHMISQNRDLERTILQLKHSNQVLSVRLQRREQEPLHQQQQRQEQEFIRQKEQIRREQERWYQQRQRQQVALSQEEAGHKPGPRHQFNQYGGRAYSDDGRDDSLPSISRRYPLARPPSFHHGGPPDSMGFITEYFLNSQQQRPAQFDANTGGQRRVAEERHQSQQAPCPQPSQPAVYSRAESSSRHTESDDSDVDENPLIWGIDRDMIEAQHVIEKYVDPADSIEGAGTDDSFEIPFDPNLICPKCGKKFRRGEIQKLRKHHRDCQG